MPQPCEGRCWNSPSESRSPNFTLRTFDSCIAVAIAIVAARGGIPRCTAMAVIAAALLAWSGAHENVEPDAVTRHCSPDTSARRCRTPSTAAVTVTASTTTTSPATSRRWRGVRGCSSARVMAPRGVRGMRWMSFGRVVVGVGGSVRCGQSLAWSAELSTMPCPSRGRASTAPVTELRRKSRLLCPDSSRALVTVPSGRVTFVPAVT